jgi:hypothetical protein
LLGILVMLFVLAALASALVVSLKKPWTRIAVRVLGSWIAASGLLLFGWSLQSSLAPNPGPSGWLHSTPAFPGLGACRPILSAALPRSEHENQQSTVAVAG